MKKILNIAICLMVVFFMTAPMAMGVEFRNTVEAATDGSVRVTLTVAGVETTSQPLLFDSSPNVSVSVWTETMSYSIQTTNILTNQTVGYEYGTLSTASGYMQAQKAVEQGAGVTATTSGDTLTISGNWVGGESIGS